MIYSWEEETTRGILGVLAEALVDEGLAVAALPDLLLLRALNLKALQIRSQREHRLARNS